VRYAWCHLGGPLDADESWRSNGDTGVEIQLLISLGQQYSSTAW
jgi:hypothetical protein